MRDSGALPGYGGCTDAVRVWGIGCAEVPRGGVDAGRPAPAPHPYEASAQSTSATRQWAWERLDEPLVLADLAAHARMSRRTFARRFQNEAGISPGRWLAQQRIARARHLLETTDLPVNEVAARAGFGTDTSLRQHPHAAIGVPRSPTGGRSAGRPTPPGERGRTSTLLPSGRYGHCTPHPLRGRSSRYGCASAVPRPGRARRSPRRSCRVARTDRRRVWRGRGPDPAVSAGRVD
ncbi:Helix-turn-helix domain-containing protein [Streptomyces sp. DvalAA-43]|nr:Helix-turn-helix domain-containing protein [Streptomyces sp. DvalAA-43]